ncbi:hypothetical protein D3C86_1932860 [compost metagenome]
MRQQGGKAHHFDVRQVLGDLAGQLHALLQAEQRIFLGAGCYSNDHAIEQTRGAFDQIAVALRNGVEGARVQHSVHRDVLAGVRKGIGW